MKLTLAHGPAGTEIAGLGHAQPERVMDNHELEGMMDTSDEWIQQRTGIVTRHVIAEGETVVDLAVPAARMALSDSMVSAADIDLVVVATTTAAERTPNTAGRIAEALGLGRDGRGPGIIDLNTACSGFEYALGLADQAIRTGSASPCDRRRRGGAHVGHRLDRPHDGGAHRGRCGRRRRAPRGDSQDRARRVGFTGRHGRCCSDLPAGGEVHAERA